MQFETHRFAVLLESLAVEHERFGSGWTGSQGAGSVQALQPRDLGTHDTAKRVLLFSSVKTVAILTALLPALLIAQNTLSSSQAVALALQNHPLLKAGAAAEKAAAAHVRDMKGAKLPRVDYTESWTRSNNQVFVFGSLLEQQQFA